MKELHEFIQVNRKNFPRYFKTKELKKFYNNNELFKIYDFGKMIGFYVLSGSQFRSVFIDKTVNETTRRERLNQVFNQLQKEHKYITIAVNNRSLRVKKFALRYNFKDTQKVVIGKDNLSLNIYEWAAN